MEQLYLVGLRNKRTGERINLEVWAESVEKATHQLCGSLIGFDRQYSWTGTEPVYVDNKLVER